MTALELILLLTLALPALLPAAAMAIRRSAVARAAVTGSAFSLAGAVTLLAGNAFGEPISLGFAAGETAPGLQVDRMASILFLLVTGVLLTVQGFATRYLHGDPRSHRFFALSGATAAATLVAASGATLSVLAIGWCVAGVLLCLMLLQRSDLAEARLGARRTALTFAIGDCALLAAVAVVLGTGPDLDLRDPAAAAASLAGRDVAGIPAATLVAALIAICALARSAQFPMHRWLPSTLAAPTPVSAILHAGLINGAGLLLITLAPIVALEPSVLWTLVAAGLITALFGTSMSLVRSDIKGTLAWSTTAQMGFMVAQCATGGFAAALLHMFGHGIYKANLFLGSGGAVAAHTRSATSPKARALLSGPARVAAAIAIPGALLAASLAIVAPDLIEAPGVPILLAFALATTARATWSWLGSAGSLGARATATSGGLLALTTTGYVAIVALFERFVGNELPSVAASTPPAWLLPAVIGAAAALAVTVRFAASRSATAANLEVSAWALARSMADPAPVAANPRASKSTGSIQTTRPATIGATQ